MPDYQKGKIYKIWDSNYEECYVGSTIQELSMRMADHRKLYKQFKNGLRERPDTTVYLLFDKYGLDNCKIELEETFPCNSKMELEKREGHHIRNSKCVNKQVAGRTNKEYYQENRDYVISRQKKYTEGRQEILKEYRKQYYQDNKDKLSKQHKEYNEQNKECLKEKKKQYRIDNAETIKEKRKETYTCECGITLTIGKKSRHNKSQKHQQYLNSLNQPTDQP